ncbi:restriction endonuclease subunit S [Salmonella enterica]|nr:restriction endonuclease subunit S [Salmonella enterica]
MSGGKLPEGWVGPQLDEIATDINYGYTASSTSENIGPKMLRITDIQDNKVDWNSVPFCKIEDNQKNKYLLCNGDLVFARTGATVGKSFLINENISNIVFASYLIRVRCNKKINSHYLSYFFRSPTYWSQITEFSAGIGQPNVNGSKLKKLNLPLTSVYEQNIIAEKLDTLLAQVDSTKARLEQIPQILKRFRQAVLAMALNESSEQSRNPAKIVKLIDVTKKITDGEHLTPKTINSGIPLLSAKDVQEDELLFDNVKYLSDTIAAKALNRCKPEKNDILIVSRGATVGRTHLVSTSKTFCLMGSVLLIKLDTEQVVPEYMKLIFNDISGQQQLVSASGATAQQAIYIRDVKEFSFELISLHEQHEIVRRVEQLFAYADTIEKQVNNALTRVNNLTQSILAKAFRGELTAQWRAENPDLISGENSAAALLEKIKAERATSDGKKTSRKKS